MRQILINKYTGIFLKSMIIFIMEVIAVFKKRKQLICKFIVLFLFITGMCFEDVKADSVFAYTKIAECAKNAANTEATENGKNVSVYMEKELEVTETIVARSTTNTQQMIASFSTGRKVLKLSIAIIYVTALNLLLSNSYAMAYTTQLPEPACKTIVVNYIHNTDGKKRV